MPVWGSFSGGGFGKKAGGRVLRVASSNLQVYLDANDTTSYSGSGTTWNDISGKNNNFSWNSVSFNSSGTKYFNTNGRLCSGVASNSVGITNSTGYTIQFFAYQFSYTANAAFKLYGSNPGGSTRGIFAHLAWTDQNIYFDQGGCCDPNQRTSVASGGTAAWNFWTLRRTVSGGIDYRYIIKNTTILSTNTTAGADPALTSTAITVGGASDEYGNGSSQWNAAIGTFLVYNRGLTDDEVAFNFNALRTSYGV